MTKDNIPYIVIAILIIFCTYLFLHQKPNVDVVMQKKLDNAEFKIDEFTKQAKRDSVLKVAYQQIVDSLQIALNKSLTQPKIIHESFISKHTAVDMLPADGAIGELAKRLSK